MSKIFISYRRKDSRDITDRIYEHLTKGLTGFKRSGLFKDVNDIPAARDFRDVISGAIPTCDIVLVIIGSGWLDVRDKEGKRRLDSPKDHVRAEIEAALAQRLEVVPVLVGGAEMPDPAALPETLQPLAYLQAVTVRPDPDFKADVRRLKATLRKLLREKGRLYRAWRSRRARVAAGVMAAALLAGGGWLSWRQGRFGAGQPPANNSSNTEEDLPAEQRPESGAQEGEPEKVIPYDPNFLGVNVPLPSITDDMSAGDLLNGKVFDYTHYSLVMNERRGMLLYAACNINGAAMRRVSRQGEKWLIDKRVPRDLQKGAAVYTGNEWDRGHIVQRSSVLWGDLEEARAASRSSNFYTNTAPQLDVFNQGLWAKLENYILDGAEADQRKLSVFAGPVFRPDDWEYRGSRIPRSFWKIVAAADPGNPQRLRVSAYVMDQYVIAPDGSVRPTPQGDPSVPFDPRPYQVSVADVEALTPLQFGPLRRFDTFTGR